MMTRFWATLWLIAALPAVAMAQTGTTRPTDGLDPEAQKMLESYMALRPAPPDMSRENDPKYVESYMAEVESFALKRGELAKEFYERFPKTPVATALMLQRWVTLIQTKQAPKALEEIGTFATANPDSPRKLDLLYIRSMAHLVGRVGTIDQVAPFVEEFIKLAPPTDPRGEAMLMQMAGLEPDAAKQIAIYERIIKQYPTSEQAVEMAKSSILRAKEIGKPFELSFADVSTGKQISMKDLKGKVVVIDFWATWCGPCIEQMPEMKELYAKYKDKGVEFIGVSLDRSEAEGGLTALKQYVKDNNIPWPQYYQGKWWASEFSSKWWIQSIPMIFVVDAEGKLYSANAAGQLDRLIPEALKRVAAK